MPSPGVIYPSECSYTPLKPSTKRDDLQGVRGLAIIFVLLFHFYPDTFRNGFAGVDIFFVLSGYLMQMIYAERTSGLYSILSFYKRRFIRLLPLYYLTILATLLAGSDAGGHIGGL
uniref:Acyl_transf_3 domain-containing protein n=1 Tax=Steinernema glaseri TaxID=37863 RepID=A0A1I8A443_9BILA